MSYIYICWIIANYIRGVTRIFYLEYNFFLFPKEVQHKKLLFKWPFCLRTGNTDEHCQIPFLKDHKYFIFSINLLKKYISGEQNRKLVFVILSNILICNKSYFFEKKVGILKVGHSALVQSQLALFYEQNTWAVSLSQKLENLKKPKY